MKKPTAEEIKGLIESHASIMNLGSPSDAVDEEWIVKAEDALNRPLPDSYKWFLKEYAGGEIGGDEIYSIYSVPFESAIGGDIVYHHLLNRKTGLFDDSKLEFSGLIWMKYFSLSTTNFNMESVRFICKLRLVSLCIMLIIFMSFCISG